MINYRKINDEIKKAFFAFKKANPGTKTSATSFVAGYNAAMAHQHESVTIDAEYDLSDEAQQAAIRRLENRIDRVK